MVLRINHVNDLGECKMSIQLAIALIYTKAQFRSSHLLSWHLFWVELAKYPYVQLHVPFMHIAFSSPLLVQLIVWLQMEPRTKIHKIQLSLSFIEPSGEFALKKEHWKTANFRIFYLPLPLPLPSKWSKFSSELITLKIIR